MFRVCLTLAFSLLVAQPGRPTPAPPPSQKERAKAFAALNKAGATIAVRIDWRLLALPPGTTAADYRDAASAAGVYDGRFPASHPVVCIDCFENPSKPSEFTNDALRSVRCFPELKKLHIWEGSCITDAGMKSLFALHELRELELGHANISDEGLECLRAMPNLRLFQILESTRLTGSCLRQLSHASKLEEIDFHEAIDLKRGPILSSRSLRFAGRISSLRRLHWQCVAFDEADLANLAALRNLESLAVQTYKSRITDAGLIDVARLKNLRVLYLGRVKISPRGIAYLRALPHLRLVSLEGKELGDAELAALATLPALEVVQLDYTKVSDAGLKCLYNMKTLKEISLRGTAVTRKGLQALRAARPDLKIWWSGDGAPFPGQAKPAAASDSRSRSQRPRSR